MILGRRLTSLMNLSLFFRMSESVRIDPSELPSQSTPSLQHLLNFNQGREQLKIELLNEYLKQPYRSHSLLQKTLKGYLKEATAENLQEVCKQVMLNDTLCPQKHYLLDSIVNYYQDNIEQLLKWKDANSNPLPVLTILSAMTNPPRKEVGKYIRELNLSSPLLKIYAYSILCRMDIMSVQVENEIYELSQKVSRSEYSEQCLNVVIHITRLRQFYTIFSQSTLNNFASYLSKHCSRLPKEVNKEIIRQLSIVPPQKITPFKPFITQMEKLATNNTDDEPQRDLQQKILFLLDKHKMPSEHLLPLLMAEPEKWCHLAGQDPHLIMYLVRQDRLPEIYINSKLPCLVEEIVRMAQKPPMLIQRNDQIRLQLCFKLLLNLYRNLSSQQTKTLQTLNLDHLIKFNKVDLKTLRVIFTLCCQLKINPQKYLKEIDKHLSPTDASTISEVWYNIYRLNSQHKIKLKIEDIEIVGPIEPEVLPKLFYCINAKKPNNVDKLLEKCGSSVEMYLKNNKLHFKTLLLLLKVYAQNNSESYKFIYVRLEKALMAHFTKIKPSDNDISYVKKYFQLAKAGSRKFHDFLNELQSNPGALRKLQNTYVEREKKFDELRENQRVDKIRLKRLKNMNSRKEQWKEDASSQKPAF